MARPRTPTKILEARGAFVKHPERRRERAQEPVVNEGIGDPPHWLTAEQAVVWTETARVAGTWLTAADRILLEQFSVNVAFARKVQANPDGVPLDAQAQGVILRQASMLGLSPSDRSKVKVPGGREKPKAPTFGGLRRGA